MYKAIKAEKACNMSSPKPEFSKHEMVNRS